MTVLELSVSDIGCRRCVREMTARLRDVPGVETVTVDATRTRVTLTGSMDPADAIAALSESRHQAGVDSEAAPGAARTVQPPAAATSTPEAHR